MKIWQTKKPKLCQWAEQNIPEELRKRSRTTNLIERMNQKLKRRSDQLKKEIA